MRSSITIRLALALLLLPQIATAEEALPRWEAGFGGGVISLPQYMGSDERYTLGLPLPFVIYRGDRVNLDRNGLRANMFDLGKFSLDASLGAGLPVKNSNRARAGMPDLHFSLQAGPRINWDFHATEASRFSLRLPWRGVMDVKGHYLGWLVEPDLQLRLRPNDDLEYRLNAGVLFASQRYNDTYYSVAPAYATPSRPAFRARGGLHSLSAAGSVLWKIDDRLRLFGRLHYRNLSPGVVAGSPLVKTPHYLSAAIGIVWIFYQSEEKVRIRPADD